MTSLQRRGLKGDSLDSRQHDARRSSATMKRAAEPLLTQPDPRGAADGRQDAPRGIFQQDGDHQGPSVRYRVPA